jgi:hypothetical protein
MNTIYHIKLLDNENADAVTTEQTEEATTKNEDNG